MAEHTPGPWMAYSGHDGQFMEPIVIQQPKEGEVFGAPPTAIARCLEVGHTETTQANARLIAAAPALLKALDNYIASDGYGGGIKQQAQQATAQALGEVPAYA